MGLTYLTTMVEYSDGKRTESPITKSITQTVAGRAFRLDGNIVNQHNNLVLEKGFKYTIAIGRHAHHITISVTQSANIAEM